MLAAAAGKPDSATPTDRTIMPVPMSISEIAARLTGPGSGAGPPGLVGHAGCRGRETGFRYPDRPHDHARPDVDQRRRPDALDGHDLIERIREARHIPLHPAGRPAHPGGQRRRQEYTAINTGKAVIWLANSTA